ncbi:MAG: helix-turn-helix transcriptional regulator [Magnetococcales bacterium]|nr:helix-turn-helix transcriptional regulator [Magnetococcales bacterium]
MADNDTPSLTNRERQCLELLAIGLRGKEIAVRLGIADRTVEHHVRLAKKRLGAKSREHAVALAIQHGLIGKHQE